MARDEGVLADQSLGEDGINADVGCADDGKCVDSMVRVRSRENGCVASALPPPILHINIAAVAARLATDRLMETAEQCCSAPSFEPLM